MQLEVQALRAEKSLLSKTTQKMVLNQIPDCVSGPWTRNKVLKTVEEHYMSLVMNLVRQITGEGIAEVSGVKHDWESVHFE